MMKRKIKGKKGEKRREKRERKKEKRGKKVKKREKISLRGRIMTKSDTTYFPPICTVPTWEKHNFGKKKGGGGEYNFFITLVIIQG